MTRLWRGTMEGSDPTMERTMEGSDPTMERDYGGE